MTNVIDSCRFSLHRTDLLRARVSAYYFNPHLHDTFVVNILTRGTAAIASSRVRTVVSEGDVFVFNPFEVHAGGDRRRVIEYDVLYPTMRFVADSLMLPRHGSRCCPTLRTQVIRRSPLTEPLIESLRADGATQAAVESALQVLIRQIAAEPTGVAEEVIEAVRAACELMHDSFTTQIESQALADAAGLSKSHFTRLFHRVTGLSPQNYLRQMRLAHARELICKGEELAWAATAAGFADQAHMTREFRKVYGFTPGRLSNDLQHSLASDVAARASATVHRSAHRG